MCLLLCFLLFAFYWILCVVVSAQTISINDIASVCHKLCGNGRKKLLSDWKNEIYLFAFHFSFLMWELLLGKWVVYKHHFRGEKLNTDDRHVSNLPTPILDISIYTITDTVLISHKMFPSEQLTQKTPKISVKCLFDQQLAQGGDENSANMFIKFTAFCPCFL